MFLPFMDRLSVINYELLRQHSRDKKLSWLLKELVLHLEVLMQSIWVYILQKCSNTAEKS